MLKVAKGLRLNPFLLPGWLNDRRVGMDADMKSHEGSSNTRDAGFSKATSRAFRFRFLRIKPMRAVGCTLQDIDFRDHFAGLTASSNRTSTADAQVVEDTESWNSPTLITGLQKRMPNLASSARQVNNACYDSLEDGISTV